MGIRRLFRRLFAKEGSVDYKSFWVRDRTKNIIPLRHGKFPEGYDVVEYLRDKASSRDFGTVLDFGCGIGRLSAAFDKDRYIGVDLNPDALRQAEKENPGYTYKEVFIETEKFPEADTCLAYTVFLHLDDDTLDGLLGRLSATTRKYFIVSEILGNEWRRGGLPPVFNREKQEYADLMDRHGFSLCYEDHQPYARYINDPAFADKKNKDISFLVFEKR